MPRRKSIISTGICAALVAVEWLIIGPRAGSAWAQCGDISPETSCTVCHIEEYSVEGRGEWHGIHAGKNCCTHCHGGNCSAAEKDLAHEGLVIQPLDDIYTNCYHCHPTDYQARAERFALALGVIPRSSSTATPVPEVLSVKYPLVMATTPPAAAGAGLSAALAAGLLALVVMLLLGLVGWSSRQRREP